MSKYKLTKTCSRCGEKFLADIASQKYCKNCRKEEIKDRRNEYNKQYRKKHQTHKHPYTVEMCKHCTNCQDYTYQRETMNGNIVKFQYCAAIKNIIDSHCWLNIKDQKSLYIITTDEQKSITSYIKHKKVNRIKFINNKHDLRLRFLREIYRTEHKIK
jgi:hypothetical protein